MPVLEPRTWIQIPVLPLRCCCSLSHVWVFVTPRTAARQASMSFTVSRGLLKLLSTELMMPFNHLIHCCPLLLPSIFPSIRVFSNESVLCIRWPKNCSFSFSISPSNECSGLISFRIDWWEHFPVQGTLKSFLQHHSSKASILQPFSPQLSLWSNSLYMTTGKIKAWLDRLRQQSNVSTF